MKFRFTPAAALAGLAWIAWGAFEASSTRVYGDEFATFGDFANMALFDSALALTAVAIIAIAAGAGSAIGRLGRMSAPIMAAGAVWLALFATLDAIIPQTTALEALATAGMIVIWLSGTALAISLTRAKVLGNPWIGPALIVAIAAFPPLSEIGGSILLGAVLLAVWAGSRESGVRQTVLEATG